MSFLENMNNNPEFLNDFLKYSAYITFKSNLTVDEMYLDIRTFFRYLIFSKNENNVEFDINTFCKFNNWNCNAGKETLYCHCDGNVYNCQS